MPEKPVGKVEHYYPKVQAAAVRLTKKVKLGDQVHIVGHGDDFKEKVTSLQLDHEPIQEGQPGQAVGLWVKERVHKGDDVLLVEPDAAGAKAAGSSKKVAKARSPKKAAKAKARPNAAGKSTSSKRAKRPKPARKARKAARKAKNASKPKRSKLSRKAGRKSPKKRR